MTAGELIRSARSRAALAQHELADLLGTPRSQIARWEAGEVEPAFATVRRVLRACGFDLSMALVPFDPEAPQATRLIELSRMTPKERLDAALVRGGFERMGYQLDPYAILEALEARRVDYILIGSLARVLQGADEFPAGVDFVFPKGARDATDDAVRSFAMPAPPTAARDGDAWVYWTRGAPIKALEVPEGTKGLRDLRRRAERVHLGGGLRPWVAAPGDLVRMMEALGRSEQAEQLEAMRRVVELDRGLGPDR
jgi:transcriptional regulator with XRE-family HTH domain